jgi:hypothetical protein
MYERSTHDQKDRFTSGTIKFVLLVLAYTTPYILAIRYVLVNRIVIFAYLWMYDASGYPVFQIYQWDNLIFELPLSLFRLVFIRAVLRYKKQLTTATRLVLTGILCELPVVVWTSYLLYGHILVLPFPLFLVVGLLLARYCTKEPRSWVEAERS